MLEQYAWPGNIRELRNIAERLVVLTTGTEIGGEDVRRVLGQPTEPAPQRAEPPITRPEGPEPVDDANQQTILKVLAEENYHYGRAAVRLGMSRVTLWRRLQKK